LGLGLPITWQGWVVFTAFLALLVLGVFLFPPAHKTFYFIVYTGTLVVVLAIICYAKGEPPRWRWGDE